MTPSGIEPATFRLIGQCRFSDSNTWRRKLTAGSA